MIDTRRAFDRPFEAARRALVRAIAFCLLATIALVPSLARAHDRLHITPVDEYSRFHWTNSCESVPQKIAPASLVVPLESPVLTTIETPARACERLPRAVPPRPFDPLPIPSSSLRAPPAGV